MGNKDSI